MILYGTTNNAALDSLKSLPFEARLKRMTAVANDLNGNYKEVKDSLKTLQHELDSINFYHVVNFLSNYGIPKYIERDRIIGVLHHIPDYCSQKIFDLLQNELDKKNIKPIEFAEITDRYQIEKREEQKYYSIMITSSKLELDNPKLSEINANRKKIGLKKLKLN